MPHKSQNVTICCISKILSALPVLLPITAFAGPGHNHGGSQSILGQGEFRFTPVVTLEGHGGYENNLVEEGQPAHYSVDGLFGAVMEWGLSRQGSFAIEAALGPAAVWGEAEHFYGRIHVEEDHHNKAHDDHGENHDHDHASGQPFRRFDVKGIVQARYQPNSRVALSASWLPHYVTRSQGEDIQGLKQEVEAAATFAFGDGDVNFALGDGLESIVDGLFATVRNRSGWESDGTYLGNYTDAWLGLGFNIDRLSIALSAGPRFYLPGSYSALNQRTDWGGDFSIEYPVSDSVVAFAHLEMIYSTRSGDGWGTGFQNHVGTGVTFRF